MNSILPNRPKQAQIPKFCFKKRAHLDYIRRTLFQTRVILDTYSMAFDAVAVFAFLFQSSSVYCSAIL